MNLKQKIELLKYLSDLIHRKATGTPQQLARKLNMSSASARRYLKTLREDFDAPIAYCYYRESYYYTEAYELEL